MIIVQPSFWKSSVFCDGLVWMVGRTIEINLSFQTSQAQCGRYLGKNNLDLPSNHHFGGLSFS